MVEEAVRCSSTDEFPSNLSLALKEENGDGRSLLFFAQHFMMSWT